MGVENLKYRKIRDLFRELNTRELRQISFKNSGCIYGDVAFLRICLIEKNFQEFDLKIMELDMGDLSIEQQLEFEIMNAYRFEEDVNKCLEYWIHAIMLASLCDDLVTEQICRFNFGVDSFRAGSFDVAEAIFNGLTRCGIEDSQDKDLINIYVGAQRMLARIWQYQDDPEIALAIIDKIFLRYLTNVRNWEREACLRLGVDLALDLGLLHKASEFMSHADLQQSDWLKMKDYYESRIQWQIKNQPIADYSLANILPGFRSKAWFLKQVAVGENFSNISAKNLAVGSSNLPKELPWGDNQVSRWIRFYQTNSNLKLLPSEISKKSFENYEPNWNRTEGVFLTKSGKKVNLKPQSLGGRLIQVLIEVPSIDKFDLITKLEIKRSDHFAAENILFVTISRLNQKLGKIVMHDGQKYFLREGIVIN